MIENLNGIPKTLLIPLWARAVEISHSNPIVLDYKANEMMDQINYNFHLMVNGPHRSLLP